MHYKTKTKYPHTNIEQHTISESPKYFRCLLLPHSLSLSFAQTKKYYDEEEEEGRESSYIRTITNINIF
jgi:hypothetical protein